MEFRAPLQEFAVDIRQFRAGPYNYREAVCQHPLLRDPLLQLIETIRPLVVRTLWILLLGPSRPYRSPVGLIGEPSHP